MTAKPITLQSISIRPQNDLERMYIERLNALCVSGKKVKLNMKDGDLIIKIESDEGSKE